MLNFLMWKSEVSYLLQSL